MSGSLRTSTFKGSLKRTLGTWHIVVFLAKVYYSDIARLRLLNIRENDTGRVWRSPCLGFFVISPSHERPHSKHFP